MALRVYAYEKCSTCRRALKFLESHGVAHEAVPIVETPPSRAELEAMLKAKGAVKRLFNTSGELYRELGLGKKLEGMPVSEALALLASKGKLVKRPFVPLPGGGLVGFDEAEWKAAFPARR